MKSSVRSIKVGDEERKKELQMSFTGNCIIIQSSFTCISFKPEPSDEVNRTSLVAGRRRTSLRRVTYQPHRHRPSSSSAACNKKSYTEQMQKKLCSITFYAFQ